MAGLIALVQTDIKRVIAYSTMSQIGYMFVGAAIGAYPNGDVPPDDARVLQGAALPRRRASSSTRSTGEQDIRRMGGLGPRDAAHADGVPDRLARARRHPAVLRLLLEGRDHRRDARPAATLRRTSSFACCLVGAFLTGLYTFRLFFIVFRGEQSAFAQEHLHDRTAGTKGRSR